MSRVDVSKDMKAVILDGESAHREVLDEGLRAQSAAIGNSIAMEIKHDLVFQ